MTVLDTREAHPLDLQPLLAPIAGDHPAGEWLRYDAVYAEIRKLREADDPALPQGVWAHELKRADWNGVAERAAQVLATRSKDLQLAVWLTEAWLHLHGYAGFGAGLRLIAELCRRFWDALYPPLEQGSAEARLAPLAWAADKLVLPLESVAVTAPAGEDSAPLSWADFERALYYENLEKTHPASASNAYAGGAVTHPQFLISASLTPAGWYVPLADDLNEATDALDDLESALAETAGAEHAPSLTPLRQPLEAIGVFVAGVLAERAQRGEIAAAPRYAGGSAPALSFERGPLLPPGAPIVSRAEAFLRLREAAEFLLRSEPHSPVPYLVMRAVSWEHMPLAELLAELLQKTNDLAAVYSLLGMNRDA